MLKLDAALRWCVNDVTHCMLASSSVHWSRYKNFFFLRLSFPSLCPSLSLSFPLSLSLSPSLSLSYLTYFWSFLRYLFCLLWFIYFFQCFYYESLDMFDFLPSNLHPCKKCNITFTTALPQIKYVLKWNDNQKIFAFNLFSFWFWLFHFFSVRLPLPLPLSYLISYLLSVPLDFFHGLE